MSVRRPAWLTRPAPGRGRAPWRRSRLAGVGRAAGAHLGARTAWPRSRSRRGALRARGGGHRHAARRARHADRGPAAVGTAAEDRAARPRRHRAARRATSSWSSTPTRRSARPRTGRPTWPRPAAKIEKSKAEAGKNAGLAEARPRRGHGRRSAAPRSSSSRTRASSRATRSSSRGWTRTCSRRRRTWRAASSTTSGKLSAADRELGEIEAGKARFKVQNAEKSLRLAAHPGPPRRPADPGEELARGDAPSSATPSGRGRSWPRSRTSPSSRPACSCWRPTRPASSRALRGAPRHRRPAGRGVRGHGRRAWTRWPSRATSSRR